MGDWQPKEIMDLFNTAKRPVLVVNPNLGITETYFSLALYSLLNTNKRPLQVVVLPQAPNPIVNYLLTQNKVVTNTNLGAHSYVIAINYNQGDIESIGWDVDKGKFLLYLEPTLGKKLDFKRIKYYEKGTQADLFILVGWSSLTEISPEIRTLLKGKDSDDILSAKTNQNLYFSLFEDNKVKLYDQGKIKELDYSAFLNSFYTPSTTSTNQSWQWLSRALLSHLQSLPAKLQISSWVNKVYNQLAVDRLDISALIQQINGVQINNLEKVKEVMFTNRIINDQTRISGTILSKSEINTLNLDYAVLLTDVLVDLFGESNNLLFLIAEFSEGIIVKAHSFGTINLTKLFAESDQYCGDSRLGIGIYRSKQSLATVKNSFEQALLKLEPALQLGLTNKKEDLKTVSEKLEVEEESSIPALKDFTELAPDEIPISVNPD